MHMPPHLRFSLLTLSLATGFAHAAEATDTVQLNEVEVKARAITATHRVNIKNAEETTSTDLKDVLFNEPSISFGGGNGSSQWVSIRGMGQDQVDVKVDNTHSDTQIFHHNSRFMFDPTLVKVVAVQKGSGSASAGIGASSGAVIAETVEARDLLRDGKNVGFKVNAGISSNKGWNRGVAAYGQFGGLDALLAGNWVTEKDYQPGRGYRNLSGGEKVLNSGLGQRGVLAKLGYRFNENNRLELSHRQEKTYGKRALREEFDFSQVYETVRWDAVRKRYNLSQALRRQGYTVDANGFLIDPNGNKIIYTANNDPRYRVMTQDTTNLEFQGSDLGFIDQAKANVYRLNATRDDVGTKTEVETYGANVNLDSRILDKHTLKYGINWRTQESKPASKPTQAGKEQKDDYGVYVEGIWDLAPVTLTTGLRYDYFDLNTSGNTSVSDGNLNPSLGLIYDVNDQLAFNASLNYATRSPRLYEAALAGARNIVTSPNLKAERSRSTEIGFNYRPLKDLSLSGSYFWQTIKDVNDFRCTSGSCSGSSANYHSGVTQSFNNGKIKNHGYELNANYRWAGLISRLGVAYSKPSHYGETDLSDMNTKAMVVGRTWTAGLSYQFNRPNVEVGWRGRFVQSATGTPSRGSSSSEAPVRRAGYGVNDIYANWKPTGKDDLNVNFAVNNVGNKYYRSHNQRAGDNTLPEVGRDFRLSLNYRF